MGIQVADGAIAGKGRTESVPDQPGSSCDAQLVVRLVAALSGARGSSFLPTQAFQSPPEVDRPQNAQEHIAHLERLCGQQALELDLLRSEVDVLKKVWHLLPSNSDTRS